MTITRTAVRAATPFPPNACLNPDCVRTAARTAGLRLVRPGWQAIVLSVAVSIVAHLSALAALVPGDRVQIAGGAPAALAALGNSFADFTQGSTPTQSATADPSPVDPPLTPENARETSQPVQPTPGAPGPQPQALAMATPSAPALTAPGAADPVVPLTTDPTPPPPEAVAPAQSALAPAAEPVTEPAQAAPVSPRTPVAQAVAATPPTPVAPASEVAVQQAEASTPRPQRRPEPRTQTRQEPAPRERAQTASTPQAAGNAEQDARRGSAEGAASASATAPGTSGAAQQAGNAAVSNYPGQVMERIRRTRQQRVTGRGVAVVSFSVTGEGGLAAASIQASSGSPAIDSAALDHIRRAAPFPAPPAGAGRSFAFEFVVR